MQTVRGTVLFGVALGVYSLAAIAADAPVNASTGAQSAPAAICQEAVVSPVSGYAECVKPRGAPVAPPPKRPDAPPAPSAVDSEHADKDR
jgi:hypothetical protein